MGRSTVAQLIKRAQNQNEYDNHGVASDEIWIDHFNSALQEMTDDIKLDETMTINFVTGTEDYDLPEDYYAIRSLSDTHGQVRRRRNFEQEYPPGYWIKNKGNRYAVNLKGYSSNETFTLHYYRYPALLDSMNKDTQKPEIQTIAEDALVFKAISKALLNNNQIGKSEYFEGLYKAEIGKINTAETRARG